MRQRPRGRLLLSRSSALGERWGWPGMAALACVMLSAALWSADLLQPAKLAPTEAAASLTPPAAAGTSGAFPGVIDETLSGALNGTGRASTAPATAPPPGSAERRLQDLTRLLGWIEALGLQVRAADYRLDVDAERAEHWHIELRLDGTAADLQRCVAALASELPHARLLGLSLGRGGQDGQDGLTAHLSLALDYRAASR